MALTARERKKLLGRGGLSDVARATDRTPGHVSQVNRYPKVRRDEKVFGEITRRIVAQHPDINPSEVWPLAS